MFPLNLNCYLERLSRETARMSWPGQMNSILKKGTKLAVEHFFATSFLSELIAKWNNPIPLVQNDFDLWHKNQTEFLGELLSSKGLIKVFSNGTPAHYHRHAIACKLFNTFLHQLMKYENYRGMWANLHLVLDHRVFNKLIKMAQLFNCLKTVVSILKCNPYSISYNDYTEIQNCLLNLIVQLNQRPDVEYTIHSRIELNVLWI